MISFTLCRISHWDTDRQDLHHADIDIVLSMWFWEGKQTPHFVNAL